VVDDDVSVRESLELLIQNEGWQAETFASAQEFLATTRDGQRFDCVVSDVRMPGMSGLDLVQHLKSLGLAAPVILITGHGDVDMAVAAIKVGAFDFIEKPFDESRLLASVRSALDNMRQPDLDGAELKELQSRFNTLSARQRQVMELAVAGLSNKEIGSQLSISPKTVENHRAWVMERIGARNIAELVRMAMKIQARP